jgi:hypothetical protein
MDLTGSYGDALCKHEGGSNSTRNPFFFVDPGSPGSAFLTRDPIT